MGALGVDLLADAADPPVLDGAVAAVDVEEGVLEQHGAASHEEEDADRAADAARARTAAAAAAAAGEAPPELGLAHDMAHPLHIFFHRWPRHLDD